MGIRKIGMGVHSRFLVLVSRSLDTMDVFKVALFYICVAAFFGERYCEGCTNDLTGKSAGVRLLNDLFCSYNKNVRPVMSPSTQTVVNTTFYIFSVHMDEEWDVLQMSIQLIMAWKDEFLTWDSSKYENIETINTESTKIWVPNIMSYDMGFNGDNRDYSYFLPASVVKVNSKGIAKYNHRIQLTARCSADVFNWPFDSHNCTFLVGSPTFGNKFVNFSFPNGYFDLDYYSADREWEVANVEHSCLDIFGIHNASHCLLKYDVNIVRFSTMYFSSIIIPAIVISLMRTFTFLMGHETYLRIILLCLFFISELLFLQYLDIKIPNNGEESVLIILLYRNSLLLTAMAIIICIISNELYKRGTEDLPRNGPEWLKSVSRFLLNKRPITLLTSFNTQGAEHLIERNVEEDVPNSQRDENASFWKTLSILLDRISFIITLVTSLICFWAFIP